MELYALWPSRCPGHISVDDGTHLCTNKSPKQSFEYFGIRILGAFLDDSGLGTQTVQDHLFVLEQCFKVVQKIICE